MTFASMANSAQSHSAFIQQYLYLKDAREKRDEAKKLLAQGIDPSPRRIAANEEPEEKNSFESVAREWFESYVKTLSPRVSFNIISLFERELFPVLGNIPFDQVKAQHILQAANHVQERGAIYTVHKLIQLCGQLFKYAVATGREVRIMVEGLHAAFPKAKVKHMATILDKKKIGQLLRDIDAYRGGVSVKTALQLAPLVFVRPSNLAMAEWREFNFDTNQWTIPADKMKMEKPHIVPLSRQVKNILLKFCDTTVDAKYCFPAPRKMETHISAESIRKALRSMGYGNEDITTHGFRSMASTCLNEMGFNSDWIERQLAHTQEGTIRGTYNFADYLPERIRMMQAWADYLDELKNNS